MKSLTTQSKSPMVTGSKSLGLGWCLGIGGMILLSGIQVAILVGLTAFLAMMLGDRTKLALLGLGLGVGAMILFAPLISLALTAGLIILAVIGALVLFMRSEPSSPTSRR